MKAFAGFLMIMLLFVGNQISIGQENWGSYVWSSSIQDYVGCQFRLQASVKTKVDDDSASARLWIRVDKKEGSGFFENMWYKPIRNNKWGEYVIEGKVDEGALKIVFGTLCQFNGLFYYDNIRLDVKINENEWKNIFAENFEDSKSSLEEGIQSGNRGSNPNYKAEIFSEGENNGNKCLLIKGQGVPNFGINNKIGKYAQVNGIKLYYEIYGEGQPLLVLHGNGGSIENATPMYSHLIKKYKVIAIDSRAQGRSSDGNLPLTYEQMAADINGLLDQLKIDSVYIWGQSDGAILGLILAMDYPKKVKKVLAFGANIQPDSLAIFPFFITHSENILLNSNVDIEKKLNKLMLDHPNIPFSALSKIKAPVLIMVGDRDLIRPEHTLKLFQNIPNSQLCIIPGATHGACWEKMDLFLPILDEFFDQPFTMPDTKEWYE